MSLLNKISILMLFFVAGCSTTGQLASKPKITSDYTIKMGGELTQLQQGLIIKHVELHFDVFPENKKISGKTIYTIETLKPITKMSLDLDAVFNIQEITFNQKQLPVESYQNPNGELVIELPQEVMGQFNLTVVYEGTPYVAKRPPWEGGFVWSKTEGGEDWVATVVWGGGCDLFWPCIDNPQVEPERADIYITVDKNLVAASNGLLQSVTELNERKTYHWRTLNSINNYAISFNIGPFELITDTFESIYGNSFDLVYYHLPRNDNKAQQLFDEIPVMLNFYERMIGPYPFANEKVGVVDSPHLGMEHQTINAYGNNYKKDGYGFDFILYHEFSHEYFGNQLTNENYDDLWLHEGFGSYMQPLFAQYSSGERAFQSYLHSHRKNLKNQFPLVSDKVLNNDQVYKSEIGPASDVYSKGALVVHTLRELIGDPAFFSVTSEVVYGTSDPKPGKFQPRFSTTKEFIQIVNKITGKDYQWFFDVYLYQAELPILEQKREQAKLILNWKAPNDFTFPMPLEVSINGEVITLDMASPQELAITPKDVVIIDPMSKILRQEKAIDAYQVYKEQAYKEEQLKKENKND
ncbi:MAG: M1 family metallopeptidase [Marinicella sp.]